MSFRMLCMQRQWELKRINGLGASIAERPLISAAIKNVRLSKNKKKVMLAADNFIYSQGVGMSRISKKECVLELRDVLFVPSLKMNFYSVSKSMTYKHYSKIFVLK